MPKVLEIKNATKHFGGITALDRCSIAVEQGKITALIGPNGSGKTTLFHAISNLVSLDQGSIHFKGNEITHLNDFDIAKLGISRTFQDVRLFKYLTVQEHLAIAFSQDDEKLFNSFFSAQNCPKKKIMRILEQVNLEKPESLATELSYGQRKLLDLAVALAKPHELLMLDEPVAGINPMLRKEIKSILDALRRKGETILLIEHDMNFVMDVADHVIVMDAGKIIAEGKPKDIQNNSKVLKAYLGG